MKLLIIEDCIQTCEVLASALRHDFAIDVVQSIKEGLFKIDTNTYEIVLVDFHLPDGTGARFIQALRDKSDCPAIFMSADISPESKHVAFEAGADDYIPKPISIIELKLRIRAVQRRAPIIRPKWITTQIFSLCEETRTVSSKNGDIYLRNIEFQVLSHLTRRAGQFIRKTEIIESIWIDEKSPFSNCLEVHVMSIRRKFRNLGLPSPIVTEKNVGYMVPP